MGKQARHRRRLWLLLPAVILLLAAAVVQPGAWATPNQVDTTVPIPLPGQELFDVTGWTIEVFDSVAGDVRLTAPAGAVVPTVDETNAVTLRYTPEQAGWTAPNADPHEIGHVFSLEVWKWGIAGDWLTGFSFQLPITVRINYTAGDVIAAAGGELKVAYNVGQAPFNWVLLSNQQSGTGYVTGQIQTMAPSQQTWFALVVVPPPMAAEAAATITADAATRFAFVSLAINAVKDAEGNPVTIPGLKAYSATASYSSAGIQMMQVTGGTPPFDMLPPPPTVNIQPGQTTFSDSQTGAQPQPPITVAKLYPSLKGSALDSYSLTISFTSITDTADASISGGAPVVKSFKRGDAKVDVDDKVDIVDALFIAQWVVKRRPTIDLNAINAASPQRDGASGDKIDIVDALFIAQREIGIRDDEFVWQL